MNFGRYQITARLGAGGMAEVFLARLAGIGGFDKTVVIKRILDNCLQEEDFIRMFLDEARVAANLNHPNIVQIFEIDQVNEIPFIVMEYVNGPSFAQVLKAAKNQNKLFIGHAARVLAGASRGLHYAHEATDASGEPLHLVHRDVSPHNVLLTRSGIPKVVDFGIAKSRGRLTNTRAGGLKGKLKYMAPEQIRHGEIDRRADVFAVGVCIYQATLGRMPFSGASEANLLSSIVEGKYQLPGELNPEFPPALEQIVISALHNDPQKRTPTCKQLAEELEAFASAGPQAAGQEDVAKWLNELVPHQEGAKVDVLGTYGVTPSGSLPGISKNTRELFGITPTGVSGSGYSVSGFSSPGMRARAAAAQAAAGQAAPTAEEIPIELDDKEIVKPSKKGLYAGIAAAAVVLIGAGVGFALWLKPEPPPPAVTTVVPPTVVPQISDRDTVTGYIEAAKKLYAEKRHAPALEMLGKARGVGLKDPELDLQLVNLTDEVEKAGLLASADRAFSAGNFKEASASAKRVIDRDPDNAEALAMLTKVREKLDVQRAPEERKAHGFGKLSVTTDPRAMAYLDDRPLGKTPLNGLKVEAGRHVLELRIEGYHPITKSVRIASGKSEVVKEKLSEAGKAPVKVAEPPPAEPPGKKVASVGTSVAAADPPPPPDKPATTPVETAATEPPPKPPLEPPKENVASTTTAPPPANPVPQEPPQPKKYVSRLPPTYGIGNAKSLLRVFGVIEQEAVAAGVPMDTARGATAELSQSLLREISPGQQLEVFPRAMHEYIVSEAGRGKDRGAIASGLAGAHNNGTLRKKAYGQ